jgi:hypothetical protein
MDWRYHGARPKAMQPHPQRALSYALGPAKPLAGLLFDRVDFATLVIAALGTHAMRHFALVAVGAIRQGLRRQKIVRATLRGACLRVSPFWIRHEILTNHGRR